MASPKKRVNPLLIVLLAVLLAAAVAVGVVFAKLHSKVTALQSGASFTLRYEITPNSPQTPPLLSILPVNELKRIKEEHIAKYLPKKDAE